MLSNAYFLAKFRFDTAENEPAKNLQKIANFLNFSQHRSSATLLRLLIDEVDRAWQALELPQAKAALRKQMQTRLNETLERLIHQQGLGGALLGVFYLRVRTDF